MIEKFNRRGIIGLMSTVGLVVSLPFAALAAEVSEKAAALLPTAIKEAGSLRIAMPDQGKPFAYKEGNDLKGMDVDLAEAVAGALGLEPKIELVPFDAALTGLASDKFDISFGEFYIRAERLQVADFVSSWQTFNSFLVRGDGDLKPEAVADLCGRKAASMAASAQLDGLQKTAAACPADAPLEVSAFPNMSNAVLALTSGRVDAVFVDRGVAEEAMQADPTLATTGKLGAGLTAIAIKRGEATEGLAEAVQAAMQHLAETGEYQVVLDTNGVGFGSIAAFDIYDETSAPPVYE